MAIDTEKNTYTVVFAVVMVVVVGSVLAFVASGLKERIAISQRLEKQQNILYAMGINENVDESNVNFVTASKVDDAFKKYIKEQLVLENGKSIKDSTAYLVDVKKEFSKAKKGQPARLPLFVGEKDGKKIYIIPLYGKGLWDDIWGYISLNPQMTVEGVYFDHKGETAGLGANLNKRYFMDDFAGELILKGSDKFEGITVAKGNNDPTNERKDDNKVDALAGATITGTGITIMIHDALTLYKPYLETIREK